MIKFFAGFVSGGVMSLVLILGVQWFGIESAKDTISKRVHEECERQLLKRTQCMQKRSQKECGQMILDICGPDTKED